jgi:PAS domain S-box-containing protein
MAKSLKRFLPSSLGEWGALALIVAAALAVAISLTGFLSSHAAQDRDMEALLYIETLVSTLKDAETGQRGFVLTGDEAYLQPYARAREAVSGIIQQLTAVAADTPSMGRALTALQPLISAKIDELQRTIDLRREEGFDAALAIVRGDEGERVMEAIRATAGAAQDAIRRDLTREQQDERRNVIASVGAVLGAGALAALLLAGVAWTRRRLVEGQASEIEILLQENLGAKFDLLSIGALLDALPVGVFIADASGRVLRTNQAAARVWGGPPPLPTDIAGYGVYQAWSAASGKPVATGEGAMVRALQRGEPTLGQILDIRRFDGSHGTILNSVAPIRAGEGAILGAVAIVQDITEPARVQRALREREEQLQLFIEAAPAGIAIFDRDMRYVVASRRYRFDYGINDRDIIGRSHYDIFPEVPERWREIHRRCLAGAVETCPEGEEFPRADGETQWVRWEVRPWRAATGDIGGIILFAEDITERRRREDDLRASEARLRRVVDQAPLPIMVHTDDGEVLQLNRAWTQASGYSISEIPTVAAWTKRAYGDDADRVLAMIRENRDRRTVLDRGEFTVRAADGSLHPWLFRSGPGGTDEKNRRLIVVTAMDLTEQKRQEEEIRRASRMQAAILDALPANVALLDAEGTILAVNDGWRQFAIRNGLLNANAGIGENYLSVCDGASGRALNASDTTIASTVAVALRAIIAGKSDTFATDYVYNATDQKHWFRLIAAPVPRGEERGAVVMHLDITEAKATEERLRQAQKLEAIGQLTSGIAHDFGNYLTVILWNLDLLASACANQPKAVEAIELTKRAAGKAEHLIGQLRRFSRGRDVHLESLNSNEVITGIADLLRRPLPPQIELVPVLANDLWRARADRSELETALLNLVVNARDALPDGGQGRIEIRTANASIVDVASASDLVPGDYVEVSVVDNGRGMPASVIAHAFEPFFTTKGQKGTGLGLAQVYGFTKQMKGHVEIASHEGSGTTVRILLPRDTAVETLSAA